METGKRKKQIGRTGRKEVQKKLSPSLLRFEHRLKRSDESEEKFIEADLDLMDYSTRSGRYKIRLAKNDVKKHNELLKELLIKAAEG